MNILGHYYLSFEIIISVSFLCEIGFSFLPTASSVCDLIAGSHTFCYRVCGWFYLYWYAFRSVGFCLLSDILLRIIFCDGS